MFHQLRVGDGAFVFDCRGDAGPRIVHVGAPLDACDAATLALLSAQGPRPSTADEAPALSLAPTAGGGFLGAPAIALGGGMLCVLTMTEAVRAADALRVAWRDAAIGLRVEQTWTEDGAVVRVAVRLINDGAAPLSILWAAAATAPIPPWAQTQWSFAGRWAGEFNVASGSIAEGIAERVSVGGRPGFENAGYALLGGAGLGDDHGMALAMHLAWSGNARTMIERTGFGLAQIQIGERLDAGEVTLGPGEAYESPQAILTLSRTGLNGVRAAFHRHARATMPQQGLRRVHFNSWEAAYFDVDPPRLIALAEEAAALGAERFVLDDGWFEGRRSDRTSLGDWTPDRARFPDGLAPLIAHVERLGMDFGLWVEPEMVSPDSALYRAHPDWVLHAPGRDRPTQRNQLCLDLTQAAVRDHLFATLDALLHENRIAYLKWDHNRELFPAQSAGAPAARAQTLGFYALVDRLRAAHPHVAFESCASGGGRIDFGVLSRMGRVWASDNTDAIERLRIQSALSLFLPPEAIGSHVGASPNPSTGRRLGIGFRARVAMFAHMGIEADPTTLSEAERAVLRDHIAFYKAHRSLLSEGDFRVRSGEDPDVTIWSATARDRRTALVLAARVVQARGWFSPPVRIGDLDPNADYRIELVRPWPEPARHALADAAAWRAEPIVAGRALAEIGLPLPLFHPETAWLVRLQAVA